ncbi:hypothetical protein CWB99_09585 [Pseudoalteromonas rubra]|uniref:Uncharacterized protein n=1 Tax=Pseudoalteromonas rubra TaxID=43658 RepID=A0A5S3WMG7_9GAMM|nr:hypothetical protein [Pseudoalteromonas rubra]TMP29012.1 hypothetical protein CWB99_09585 [Pseudoalteromonas rubra]TMP29188.1 hypothetical protein CWC00_19790 [Pseudoalteromonas rubra]
MITTMEQTAPPVSHAHSSPSYVNPLCDGLFTEVTEYLINLSGFLYRHQFLSDKSLRLIDTPGKYCI